MLLKSSSRYLLSIRDGALGSFMQFYILRQMYFNTDQSNVTILAGFGDEDSTIKLYTRVRCTQCPFPNLISMMTCSTDMDRRKLPSPSAHDSYYKHIVSDSSSCAQCKHTRTSIHTYRHISISLYNMSAQTKRTHASFCFSNAVVIRHIHNISFESVPPHRIHRLYILLRFGDK